METAKPATTVDLLEQQARAQCRNNVRSAHQIANSASKLEQIDNVYKNQVTNADQATTEDSVHQTFAASQHQAVPSKPISDSQMSTNLNSNKHITEAALSKAQASSMQ